MKKFLGLAAVLVATILTPMAARAADPGFAPYDWNGFYAGVTVGDGFGSYLQASPSGDGVSVNINNIVFGGTVGYNWQSSSNLLLGFETDFSSGPRGITPQGTAGPFWSCTTGDCDVNINYFGTSRIRVGYTSDAFLLYGTAGLALASYDGGIRNSAQQGTGQTNIGWTAGVGAEYGISSNISMKAEFLHVDVGKLKFGTGVGTEDFSGLGSFNVARVGLNLRF